jgi:hypothetical protein
MSVEDLIGPSKLSAGREGAAAAAAVEENGGGDDADGAGGWVV